MDKSNKYLDIGLKIRLDEYRLRYNCENCDKRYVEFYDDIANEILKNIFSIYHGQLNNLFDYLNTRISTGHFTANESRELIYLIDDIQSLKRDLNGTILEFNIDKYYEDIILKCGCFLENNGGSRIPADFEKIRITYLVPIFILGQQVNIKNGQDITNYRIKPIGRGSYADVFKYKDKYYNKYFALKRAKEDLTDNEYERFKIEFEEIKKLKSPYVIEVYNFDEINRQYTMEYMDMTLEKYILENNNKLEIKDRINIVGQVLKAFTYIHSKNILHRDISTKNVLIKKYEDVIVVKISDFGLVKLPESDLTRKSTEIKGFFNDYKDLEIKGFDNYNAQHEAYALTKLVYFIMTGKFSLERYNRTQFKDFVEKGITDDFNVRYSDIKELKISFNKTVQNLT